MAYRRGSGHACLGHIVHASDAYYLPRDSTPHDRSPPNDESTQNTRGLPLRGSIDFRGVHSRASEVIVATSMIDSDYRYTQDAPQRDRSAILHGSGGQHPTAQPNQHVTPLQNTLYCAALVEKQQRPHLLVDPHQAQQVYAAQSRAHFNASTGFGQTRVKRHQRHISFSLDKATIPTSSTVATHTAQGRRSS